MRANTTLIKNRYIIIFIFLLLLHLGNNFLFLKMHPLPEGKDSYAHITAFLNFSQILKYGASNPFFAQNKSLLYNLFFVVADYPPFFYTVAFLVNVIFGSFLFNAALFTGTLFLIVLLVAVYNLGAINSSRTGLVAAFLCGMYPMILWPSRHFSLELPLAAMAALSVFLLVKTDFFKNRIYSIFLGINLGLGMLTKQTFVLYLLGPGLVTFYFSFYIKDKNCKRDKLINLIICILCAFLISGIFYSNPQVFSSIFSRTQFIGAVPQNNILSVAHFSYYIKSLFYTLGWAFTFLCFCSVFKIATLGKYIRYVLLSWILIPFFAFTFILLKYGEYTIAYLPAIALISANWIDNIDNKLFRRIVVLAVFITGLYNFYSLSLARNSMYYSSYYLPKYRIEPIQAGNKMGGETSLEKMLREIGNTNCNVGVFYDETALVFPGYFLREVFSFSNKKAQIVDLSFNTAVFFNSLDRFDYLIFITRSQKSWIDKKGFENYIKECNKKRFSKLYLVDGMAKEYVDKPLPAEKNNRIIIAKEKVEKLINLKKNLSEILSCNFYAGKDGEEKEAVHIFRRQI